MKRRVHWSLWVMVVVGGVTAPLVVLAWVLNRSAGREAYERGAAAILKTVASAQADYRGNDRDGNKREDFWRSDVAGLYALPPGPLRLIDLSVAAADPAPVSPIRLYAPKEAWAGRWWFKTLRFADENPTRPDPDRFAVCAYPDSPNAGRWAVILNQENRLYRRAWGGPSDTPAVYPLDPLKEGWSPWP